MAGSQCVFTLEGSGLSLATVAGWGVAACVGPYCLTDWVLKGHFLAVFLLLLGGLGALLGQWSVWLPN